MIVSDSPSALQALEKKKVDHPALIIEVAQKVIIFKWVPGDDGIRANKPADRAVKEALDKEPTDDLMPFSDLNPLTAKYIHQVWQNGQTVIICKTRKEDRSKYTTCWSF